MKYFVYTHTRPDKNEIFYVGIGTYYQERYPSRAFAFDKRVRNSIWYRIFEKNNKQCIVQIVFESDSLEEIYQKEKELIKLYGKKIDKAGTLSNITDGGEFMGFKAKSLVCYNRDGSFYKVYQDYNQASKDLGISRDYIYTSISKGITAGGKLFRYFTEGFSPEIPPNEKKQPAKIYQYRLDSGFVREWRCVEDAAKDLKIDRSSIRNCAYGKKKSAGKFIWSFKSPKNGKKEEDL